MPTPPAPFPPVPASPRFDACLARLIGTGRIGGGTEGGYNNTPGDRGGPTNFGVSLRFALAEAGRDLVVRRALDMDMDGDVDGTDIRLLSREAAALVYRRCFWDRYRCEAFAAPIDCALFDQAVNAGGTAAARLLQMAINAAFRESVVECDGIVGKATIIAARRIIPPMLLACFRAQVVRRYHEIVDANPGQAKFLKGWLGRAAALGQG